GAAAACVRAPLLVSTVKAATLVAAGHAAAGAVSAPVAALTEGVLHAMSIGKLKLVLTVVLAVTLLGAGVGVYQSGAAARFLQQRGDAGLDAQAGGGGAAPPGATGGGAAG